MKLTPQQEKIVDLHRDLKYHCSTEYEYIRDHRKRISELNEGYLREKGYRLVGVKCDGRCGKKHSSDLYMRRAEKIGSKMPQVEKTPQKPNTVHEPLKITQRQEFKGFSSKFQAFESHKCQCVICKDCPCPAQKGHHEKCPV